MNEIMKLKSNHPCPTSSTLCKMISKHISTSECFVQDSELRIITNQQRIEDLLRELTIVTEKLNANKRVLEERANVLNAENTKLKELETERNKIVNSNYIFERKCRDLRITKPNVKDLHLLELGQKKFRLYKELTRIRWDFGMLQQVTKGLVTDKKNYIRTFNFPNEIGKRELSDLLWNEIERSTQKNQHKEEEKENTVSNM